MGDESKIKRLIRENGPFVWKTYWGVYFGTLGATFLGIQCGIADPARFLQKMGVKSTSDMLHIFFESHVRWSSFGGWIQSSPWMANLAVAWLVAEACEPVRIAATTILVPILLSRKEKERDSSRSGM
ncbi:DUF1279 domain containing protein [Nitzschia inconspicua]|uniref:DUF1279 domain containing protein n=1 Tax=Nitzschia inconspicua TaxID=303405 RepID=A0A9K3LW14_9STRA|nr:DUF1279 domain containing protein [Nitzschia inconspicua]